MDNEYLPPKGMFDLLNLRWLQSGRGARRQQRDRGVWSAA